MGAAHTSRTDTSLGAHVNQREKQIAALEKDWNENPRWKAVRRGYGAADVVRLRGSLLVEHTLAKSGAEKLWRLMHERPYVNSLGALTGNQAVQQVKAGVSAIYLSGWQVAADANDSRQTWRVCPPCFSRAPMRKRRICSLLTSTRTTSRSSAVSAPPRAFTGFATASSRPFRAASPMRPMPTWCGARPEDRISTSRAS